MPPPCPHTRCSAPLRKAVFPTPNQRNSTKEPLRGVINFLNIGFELRRSAEPRLYIGPTGGRRESTGIENTENLSHRKVSNKPRLRLLAEGKLADNAVSTGVSRHLNFCAAHNAGLRVR